MTIIATVLRSGGEYSPKHVQWLHQQFGGHPSVCLSDTAVMGVDRLPLRYSWPGWFSKMELFNPEIIQSDILYFDLDTCILSDLTAYLQDSVFRMLSDFYYPDKPASGMMFIPHKAKYEIWRRWMAEPERWMTNCRGDQDVLEQICGSGVARFGQRVKSYKVHVASSGMPGWHSKRSMGNGRIPADTDVLCFHGKPRPWEVEL